MSFCECFDSRFGVFRQLRPSPDDGVTLVPNESEQAVIADVRAMRARGMKLQQIANTLTRRGVPTKTGKSSRWTHQAVARILSRTE